MEKQHGVCPWQAGSLLTASLRKLLHNPHRITKPYLSDGMTAMDVGCGMGFFTIPMAEIVGKHGKVIAVDLQPQMLEGMTRNANTAGLQNVTANVCGMDSLCVDQWENAVDFALVFMMLHEVPDADRLIREIQAALVPGGKLLFAEPIVHVNKQKFQESLNMIKQIGFQVIDAPKIPICRAAVLQKP